MRKTLRLLKWNLGLENGIAVISGYAVFIFLKTSSSCLSSKSY